MISQAWNSKCLISMSRPHGLNQTVWQTDPVKLPQSMTTTNMLEEGEHDGSTIG